jgi:hypothetical protein
MSIFPEHYSSHFEAEQAIINTASLCASLGDHAAVQLSQQQL